MLEKSSRKPILPQSLTPLADARPPRRLHDVRRPQAVQGVQRAVRLQVRRYHVTLSDTLDETISFSQERLWLPLSRRRLRVDQMPSQVNAAGEGRVQGAKGRRFHWSFSLEVDLNRRTFLRRATRRRTTSASCTSTRPAPTASSPTTPALWSPHHRAAPMDP